MTPADHKQQSACLLFIEACENMGRAIRALSEANVGIQPKTLDTLLRKILPGVEGEARLKLKELQLEYRAELHRRVNAGVTLEDLFKE